VKILAHRKLDDGSYLLRVHLDESRIAQDSREVQKQVGTAPVLVQTGTAEDGSPITEERQAPVLEWQRELVGEPYPDPDYVLELSWPPILPKLDEDGLPELDKEGKPKPSTSEKEYVQMQLEEGKLLAEHALARAAEAEGAGKKLAREGETL